MSSSFSDWGKTVRAYRKRAGLNQTELAALCCCSRSTISNVERATHPPDGKTIGKLVEALAGLPPPFAQAIYEE